MKIAHKLRQLVGRKNQRRIFQANLAFRKEGKSWMWMDRGGFQSRNASTLHLLAEAAKWVDVREPKGVSPWFHVWTDDFPPEEKDCGEGVHLAFCRARHQEHIRLIPDFLFWSWPEIGVPDYDDLTGLVEKAGKSEPVQDEVFWIGNPRVHASRSRLMGLGSGMEGTRFVDIEWVAKGDECLASDLAMTTKEDRYVSLPDHSRYRYLIDVEGRGYSARLKVLLFSGRPVLMQERPWEEFFFSGLEPFVHYVPVKRNFEDLEERIRWCRKHPHRCGEIAANALAFARENLTRKAAIRRLGETILAHLPP